MWYLLKQGITHSERNSTTCLFFFHFSCIPCLAFGHAFSPRVPGKAPDDDACVHHVVCLQGRLHFS